MGTPVVKAEHGVVCDAVEACKGECGVSGGFEEHV